MEEFKQILKAKDAEIAEKNQVIDKMAKEKERIAREV
jgi:hypothetical protein